MKKLKIVFVQDHIGFHEISSIPMLSSIAKKEGHDVKLVEFSRNEKKAFSEIYSLAPDIIAYSICSNEAPRYLEINKLLKSKMNFFSLFGGPHPTFFPSFIKEDIDAMCVGEGDICFPEFLNNFGKDSMYDINNFSFKNSNNKDGKIPIKDWVEDLDALPFPDRDLLYSKSYYLKNFPIKPFMAGRGCPNKCTYCFNQNYNSMYKGKGKVLRTKSVTYLLNEIKDISSRYPLTFLKFNDDIFGWSRPWLQEFADRYPKEVGLPFLCYARPNMITEKYCQQLKRAGAHSVSIALECGNEKLRNLVLERNMSSEQIFSACENLKRAGLRVYTLNMIGLPGETEKEIFQTIAMNQQIRADLADASVFQPYPGTKISEYCKENGYLDEEEDENKHFEGAYSGVTVLKCEPGLKDKIYVLHKLFPVLVHYPGLQSLLGFFYKNVKWFGWILNFFYRFYFGFKLRSKIYSKTKVPLKLTIHASIRLLFSKHRA